MLVAILWGKSFLSLMRAQGQDAFSRLAAQPGSEAGQFKLISLSYYAGGQCTGIAYA
jgi:hypothetical protein